MADDKHYVGGDYYQLDDITGFKVRASRTQVQWDGRVTKPPSWSPRQPQDFVTGVKDDQTVPLPRPRQTNQFTVVESYVTAPAARGSQLIQVESTAGFKVGDSVLVMLDQGVNFPTTITYLNGDEMGLLQPLPGTVGTLYGSPIENAVFDQGPGGISRVFILDSLTNGILDFDQLQ